MSSQRKTIPKKMKAEILKRSGGICEAEGCQNAGREFEHRIPVALGGENSLENLWLACRPCHREKTSNEDIPRIAKANRQAMRTGQQARRKRRTRPLIQSRGFNKTLKRKFNGEVVPK